MEPAILIAIASVVISFITLGITIMELRVRNERRMTALETKVNLYWKAVEKKISDYIVSPHTPRIDELLRELKDDSITLGGRIELRNLLEYAVLSNGYYHHLGKECAAEILVALQDARIEENHASKPSKPHIS